MATITKIYPHVNVSTKALLRRYVEPTESGVTTLFAPFYSKKGPSNEIVKIYNLSQRFAWRFCLKFAGENEKTGTAGIDKKSGR